MLLSNMVILAMFMSESQTTISANVLIHVLVLICYVRLHNLDSFNTFPQSGQARESISSGQLFNVLTMFILCFSGIYFLRSFSPANPLPHSQHLHSTNSAPPSTACIFYYEHTFTLYSNITLVDPF